LARVNNEKNSVMIETQENPTPERPLGGNRYLMRQRLLAICDDFWIEDEQG